MVETPAVCMGVAEIKYVFTGVAETLRDKNRITGTPPSLQKKLNGLTTTSLEETLEVTGSILTRPF